MKGTRARWKSRDAERVAKSEPMSSIVARLRTCMGDSKTCGLFAGNSVLIKASPDLTTLLNRACFGVPIIAAPPASKPGKVSKATALPEDTQSLGKESNELQWFQLSLEEAFYLCYSLKCLAISQWTPEGQQNLSHQEIWKHMKKIQKTFLQHYKVYSHLRAKNWVVRSGLQFGADFVAYRHHPALVHSEYAIIVSFDELHKQTRLTTWSDWQSTLRLCGSVAKTLLVASVVPEYQNIDQASPSCLDNYSVEEFEIRRWLPERHREDSHSLKEQTE